MGWSESDDAPFDCDFSPLPAWVREYKDEEIALNLQEPCLPIELVELRRMMDELLSSVHARILAGETIEQIYASMGLEYTPFRGGILKAPRA